jgi:hypothetical protein
MKTVADTAELRRLAARVGATASVGRETFNSQGAKMKLVQPTPSPPPAPTPEIALSAPVPAEGTPKTADSLSSLVPTIEALGRAFVEAMRAASQPVEQPPALSFASAVSERAPVVQGPKEVSIALEKDAEFELLRAVTITARGRATRFLVVRDEDSHQVARLESADATFVFDHDRSGTLTNVSMTNQRFT